MHSISRIVLYRTYWLRTPELHRDVVVTWVECRYYGILQVYIMLVQFGLEGNAVQVAAAGASYEALREYTIIYKTVLRCYVIIIIY